jgi:hypothetical protein
LLGFILPARLLFLNLCHKKPGEPVFSGLSCMELFFEKHKKSPVVSRQKLLAIFGDSSQDFANFFYSLINFR